MFKGVVALAGREENQDRYFEANIYWDSVALGLAAAFGVGLILCAPVIGVYLMVSELEIPRTAETLFWAMASGVTFLAFLYGGYVSGVSANHSGFKHGFLVPASNLLVAVSLMIFALVSVVCVALARDLAGKVLPGVEQGAIPVWAVSPPEVLWPYVAVLLLLSFLGGVLGGVWGVRSAYLDSRRARARERELIEAMRAK